MICGGRNRRVFGGCRSDMPSVCQIFRTGANARCVPESGQARQIPAGDGTYGAGRWVAEDSFGGGLLARGTDQRRCLTSSGRGKRSSMPSAKNCSRWTAEDWMLVCGRSTNLFGSGYRKSALCSPRTFPEQRRNSQSTARKSYSRRRVQAFESREIGICWADVRVVPGARIELATPAFSGRRSTTELPRHLIYKV
jgi:hypothetical protein